MKINVLKIAFSMVFTASSLALLLYIVGGIKGVESFEQISLSFNTIKTLGGFMVVSGFIASIA